MTLATISLSDKADEAICEILRSQYQGTPLLRVDSPPGAGKTGVVERLAVQSMALLKERCMVVTQTNQQCFDLARRLSQGFPKLSFTLFASAQLELPEDIRRQGNLRVVSQSGDLPRGACVVLGNAKKWSWVSEGVQGFDLQIIDEAFQLHDAGFHLIANLAARAVLIGDPGQIDPVVSCPVERWASEPTGPHRPCPETVFARHPGIRRLTLPITRRLPQDTVSIIQPAFYPELPFQSLAAEGERRLHLPESRDSKLAGVFNAVAAGASLVQVELPRRASAEVDDGLADAMVATIQSLLEGGVWIEERGERKRLTGEMIGVACAHVTQVNAVSERLPAVCEGVMVETSNRFQGLERPVMLVYHPLSGRSDPTDFHYDAGRLCVMLSRHRVACLVFARAGLAEILEGSAGE